MSDKQPLLSIRELDRSFGDVHAVRSVTFDIGENEFFALLGPSGCGKTTLLRILAGFEQPDAGTVTLDGTNLLSIPAERRPVNLMFQSYALFPHMSVERNVGYGLECDKVAKDEIRQRVSEVLATVGLTDKRAALPNTLSGGQRQRVALARAIVKRPRLLLLDEPLSALDRKIRGEMQMELKRLQHEVGITFVVVTHDQDEAMSLADRVAVMDHGEVRQLDRPMELYRRPRSVFVADFIGTSTIIRGRRGDDDAWYAEGLPPLPCADDYEHALAIALRPEDIRVVSVDDPAAVVNGIVSEVFFQGDHALAQVAVGAQSFLVAIRQGDLPVRGTSVGLTWEPSAAVGLLEE